ncbi:MAG TPA: cadherin-like domain-containing protein, partial [Phycisphaerae bacterium]|nr:cadherin-like domain-containing protein [Phycisphaerae bacterium]
GSDIENDPLTFAVVAQASHGNVVMQADGSYVYTPADDYNGPDSFTFRSHDGELYSDPATVSVTVTPVNDAPSFLAGADLWVSREAGSQSLTGWASAIQAGPANEAAQTLTFTVTAADPSFFSVQPTVSANGTLTYTPSLAAAGTVRVTVVLSDDGGTDDGGADTSAVQSFDILVARPLILDQYGRASFNDASGDRVLVYLIGGGTGSVYFASNADSDINRILLSGTGDRSALIVSGRTSIGGIESDGSLARIVASTSDLTGRVRVGAATGQYASVLMMFANVADADIESAMPISSFIVSQWLDSDTVRDRLAGPRATTVMSRGAFQADVTFSDVDRLGNSVSMFYALGAVSGTVLTLAGGANAVYAASWTGGSIQAAYVGSIVAIRGVFSPTVTLTGQRNGYSLSLLSAAVGGIASQSIVLAAGGGTVVAAGWGPGTFQAAYVNSVVVRGDLSASLRLTDKGLSGVSMLMLSVTGSLVGVEVRARYGINAVMAGSSRNSLVLAGVAGAVAGLPAAADFLAPADPNRPIAINTFMITNASGVFENSIVSAPTLGTVILRGVEQVETGPFGLAVDANIRLYMRYLAGARPDYHSNLTESLEAEGQFQVLVV